MLGLKRRTRAGVEGGVDVRGSSDGGKDVGRGLAPSRGCLTHRRSTRPPEFSQAVTLDTRHLNILLDYVGFGAISAIGGTGGQMPNLEKPAAAGLRCVKAAIERSLAALEGVGCPRCGIGVRTRRNGRASRALTRQSARRPRRNGSPPGRNGRQCD